jgi:hypothetical protein
MSPDTELVECSRCRRKLAGYVPSMGDGSQLNARAHKDNGERCTGSGKPARPLHPWEYPDAVAGHTDREEAE